MSFRPLPLREALVPEFYSLAHKLVWLMRAALVFLAIRSLLVEPVYTTRPLLFASAAWGLFMSLCFAFIPTKRPRTLKTAEGASLLAISLHVIGHTFGWYQQFPWYDTLLHFSVPLVSVLILYALSQATDWIWRWRAVTPLEVGIYLFAMAVSLGVLWEILEFGMDQVFGTREQDDLFDTMLDLIMDVSGALVGSVAAALATRWGRLHGMDRISEEPTGQVGRRTPRGSA